MSNKFISNISYKFVFPEPSVSYAKMKNKIHTSRAMKLSINTADKCTSLSYPTAAPKNLNES